MKIRIKGKNIRRLVSLSALGAGTLGPAAGMADASTIVYSGIIDDKVGWGAGYGGGATIAGPNGVAGAVGLGEYASTATGLIRSVGLGARSGSHGTRFRFIGEPLPLYPFFAASAFPLNAKFGAPAASDLQSGGSVARWREQFVTTFQNTNFNNTDQYLLFTFTGGNLAQPLYGWAQFDVSFEGYPGPDVTLVDYAYDTSGAQLPAGSTGTPEPSTLALTGLAALALGAKGLRSWRSA